MSAALGIAQGLMLIALAPMLTGALAKLRARFQGRRGPSLLQPYFDISKALRKESFIPEEAGWIFRQAPGLMLAVVGLIALAIPAFVTPAAASFTGDALAIVFLLALVRFILALAALDTGTPFAGLGASREMSLSSLAEPVLILSVFALAIVAGSTDLGVITGSVAAKGPLDLGLSHILAFAALFIVTLAETGRIPVDNPATHLELTMVHEAMVLEYSGWRLALIEMSASLKLSIFLGILAAVFLPWGVATTLSLHGLLIGAAAYLGKIALLIFIVSVIEASFAKLRLFRAPDLIRVALVLAVLAVGASYSGLG